MLFWIAPAFKLAPYVLGGLDYLRRLLFPPAPSTQSVSPPYTPPFAGGQCLVQYTVNYNTFNPDGSPWQSNRQIILNGAIVGVKFFPSSATNPNSGLFFVSQSGTARNFITNNPDAIIVITSVVRVDGSSIECGDLPNPNSAPSVGDDGIATSPPPNLDSAPTVIEAVPPVILPSFAAALAAALAAARNALDALDAIKAVARALEALSDLLNKKNDEENKKEKEKKDKQDTIRYQFGSIERDGFLRLYPDSNTLKYVAQQLDISFITIPSYLGKYFGKFSPNYYRHKPTSNLISSLGYISFVSPTFGIMSTHHLEFRRSSIKVPENSIGFYYHLGLDGALTANAFAFYTKPKP